MGVIVFIVFRLFFFILGFELRFCVMFVCKKKTKGVLFFWWIHTHHTQKTPVLIFSVTYGIFECMICVIVNSLSCGK